MNVNISVCSAKWWTNILGFIQHTSIIIQQLNSISKMCTLYNIHNITGSSLCYTNSFALLSSLYIYVDLRFMIGIENYIKLYEIFALEYTVTQFL